MNLKNIENDIWTNVIIDTSSVKIPPSLNSYHLIHYAISNGNMGIIKQILKIDPYNILFVSKEVFISLCKLGKFQIILDLVELSDSLGLTDSIKYILEPMDDDWIIFYFMFYSGLDSTNELISKWSKYIQWDLIIGPNYLLKFFLLGHYKSMGSLAYSILDKILINTNIKKIFKANLSPIIDGCVDGFDSKVIDMLVSKSPHSIDAINYKMLSPLIVSIQKSNLELANYLLDLGANYNYITWTSPLIAAIGLNLTDMVTRLLGYKSIDLNTFDANKWLPAHHIFVPKCKLPVNSKLTILTKTSNLNVQNINGNTPIHMMFLNDSWVNYKQIIKTKPIDIYIKNKIGETPLEYFIKSNSDPSDLDELMGLITKSVLANTTKMSSNGKTLPKLSNSSQTKLYKATLKCLKSQTSRCVGEIKTKISKLKVSRFAPKSLDQSDPSIKLIKGEQIDYNLFISRDVDSYIYLLYFLEKYSIGVLPKIDLDIKITNESIGRIINFYTGVTTKYPNLSGLSIFWHDKDNYAIPSNLVKLINNSSSPIIFLFVTIINEQIDHANCLIINKTKKQIIHFEPYGRTEKISLKELDAKCKKILKPLGYKYWAPSDYLVTNSFQMLSNETNPLETKTGDIGGFCLAWTLWFFELYLRNTKSEPAELVEKSINKIINLKYSVMEYIRFYANKLRKYHIRYLKKIKYPAEKIFNINTTNEEKDYIYQSINDSISKYI